MGLRLVLRLPIGDRTFKGNVGSREEKRLNILPQLYRSIGIMIATMTTMLQLAHFYHRNMLLYKEDRFPVNERK